MGEKGDNSAWNRNFTRGVGVLQTEDTNGRDSIKEGDVTTDVSRSTNVRMQWDRITSFASLGSLFGAYVRDHKAS